MEADLFDIVEGEAAEVDLAVLGVAELDAVVEDRRVVRAEGADVHRLEAAHSAVVLQLDSRETAQRIGHGKAAEPLQFLALKCLSRNNFPVPVPVRNSDYDGFLQDTGTVIPHGGQGVLPCGSPAGHGGSAGSLR